MQNVPSLRAILQKGIVAAVPMHQPVDITAISLGRSTSSTVTENCHYALLSRWRRGSQLDELFGRDSGTDALGQ
jgi:hypothetical protein